MTRRRIYLTAAASLTLVMFVIAVQNTHTTVLHVFGWSFEARLVFLLPTAALFGSALTLLVVVIRRRAKRRRMQRELLAAGGRP